MRGEGRRGEERRGEGRRGGGRGRVDAEEDGRRKVRTTETDRRQADRKRDRLIRHRQTDSIQITDRQAD